MNTLLRLHFGTWAAAALLTVGACSSEKTMGERTVTTIGNSGGKAVSASGELELEFPAGALSGETDIAITTFRGIGDDDVITPIFDFEPDGLSFAQPVKITINSEDTDDVMIAQVDATGVPIEFLETVVNGNNLSAETMHFSRYAGRRGRGNCRNMSCGDSCRLCPPGAQGCMEPPGARECSARGSCLPEAAVICGSPDAGPIDSGRPDSGGGVDAGPADTGITDTGSSTCTMVTFARSFQRTRKADILVVLDASGSQADSRAPLVAEIDQIHAELINLQVDAQIGVLATPTPPGQVPGAVIPVATGTTGNTLSQVIDFSYGGSGEELFDVTLNALSGPNPFVRPDAHLLVLYLADEDDQSQILASQLNQILQASKLPIHQLQIRINAIDGGNAGCSGPGGSASPAPRIVSAVNLSGGARNDICTPPYTSALTDYGPDFGLLRRFDFDGADPATIDPASVGVRIDGGEVAAGPNTWSFVWNAPDPAFVEFSAAGAPAPGANVEVYWSPLCN